MYSPSWQDGASLSSDVGLHLYRAVQECLGNAIRHSGGTEVAIRLYQGQDVMEVTVSDTGTGIPGWDNEKQQQLDRRPTALGLTGLQKRMAALEDRCAIESGAQGTSVRLTVPAMQAARAEHSALPIREKGRLSRQAQNSD